MNEYKNLINYIYEKDGTLYIEEGDEYIPMEADLDCYSDHQILSRENVREMPYEVDTNLSISHVSLPSSKLEFELETNVSPRLDRDEVEAILDYFSEELEAADEAAREELIPMEREAIKENFERFLENYRFDDDDDNETKIQNFLNDLQEEYKFPRPDFHSDNEVREICRKWLTERSAQ